MKAAACHHQVAAFVFRRVLVNEDNNSWIKLHRKILKNEFLRHDPTARNLFITLLLLANRFTGKCIIGRFYLSELTGYKPTTNYKAQKRLEKHGLITTQSNNKMTEVTICKWGMYQSDQSKPSINQVKTRYKRSNTIQEERIENRDKTYIVEMQSIYDLYIEKFRKDPSKYKLTDKRKAKLKARLKDAGFEMLKQAILNTSQSQFHNGDNDRGWRADLDFIIRSYEQVERLASDDNAKVVTIKDIKPEEMEYVI